MASANSTITIHPTAVVDKGAEIGEGTAIGPYCVIGPNVVLGKRNRIASHVVFEGRTRLGDDNAVFQFASIGAAPQDLKYAGEDTALEIGNNNVIREYVTLQPGTVSGHRLTRIGSGNMFMACSHVGHDGQIGDLNIFANSCALAGHVTVGSKVILGGLCGIHQFTRIGDLAMLGAGCMITKDIPPYCIAQGDRAGLVGINQIGLERNGFSIEQIQALRRLYREIFYGSHKFNERVEIARQNFASVEAAQYFIRFIAESERGITFPRRRGESGGDYPS